MTKCIYLTLTALLFFSNVGSAKHPYRRDSVEIVNVFVQKMAISKIIDNQYSKYVLSDADVAVINPDDYDESAHKFAILIKDIRIDNRKATIEAVQYPPKNSEVQIRMLLKKKKDKWVLLEKHIKNSVMMLKF